MMELGEPPRFAADGYAKRVGGGLIRSRFPGCCEPGRFVLKADFDLSADSNPSLGSKNPAGFPQT